MRLTEQQLQFLAGFAKRPEALLLVDILKARLWDCEQGDLRKGEGASVYRAQGRCLELDELIADITQAQAQANRNEQNGSRRFRPVAAYSEP
jgi:hypothetical protein